MDVFAEAGFRIIGADDVLNDLLVGPGALGRIEPLQDHWLDIRRAAEVEDFGIAGDRAGAVSAQV
jgi:DUF1009 family protein